MKYSFFKIILLSSIMSSYSTAGDWDFLSVNGYGSLGVAYQDNKDVLYRSSFHANKGSRGDVSLANYSNLGLQLDAHPTNDLTFTIQGIMSESNSEGNLLELGWANMKYQVNDDFDIKVGRMQLPTFMDTDISTVGYTYDMIKLPTMYKLVPFSSYSGIELSHKFDFDELSILSRLIYGQAKSKTYNNYLKEAHLELKEMKGLMIKLMYQGLTLRFAYNKNDLNIKNADTDNKIAQLYSLGIPEINEAIARYSIKEATYLALGAMYDFENAYIKGEYIELKTDSFISDNKSWYINMGYNFENWSPYILYSQIKSQTAFREIKTNPNMSAFEMGTIAAANQGFSNVSLASNVNSEVSSIGVRYNLTENSVLKFQYEYLKEHDLINYNTNEVMDVNIHIFSSAISFVF